MEIADRVVGCHLALARAFRPRRGMALMDNLWALAIVAAVVAMVIGFGLLAQASLREYRATSLLTQLLQAVTTTFQSTRDYGGESANLLTTLCKFQRLPEDFAVGIDDCDAVTVEHPFGGSVTVKGGHGSESNRFKIEFETLEVSVCAALAEKSAGKSRGRTGLVNVIINDSEISLPYNVIDVADACDENDDGNSVAWVYY